MNNLSNQYLFVGASTPHNKPYYKPDKHISYFHQLCAYKDIKTNKFQARSLKLDENFNILSEKIRYLNADQCKKLMALSKDTELQIYPTNTINNVGYPNCDDIIKSQSELLR